MGNMLWVTWECVVGNMLWVIWECVVGNMLWVMCEYVVGNVLWAKYCGQRVVGEMCRVTYACTVIVIYPCLNIYLPEQSLIVQIVQHG